MSTDMTVRRQAFTGQTHEWLASGHGTETGQTITVDLALFDFATVFTGRKIPSGVAVGKVTGTGKYGPYNNSATDGREVCAGLLFMDVDVAHISGTPTGDVAAVTLRHCFVKESKLPTNHGVDAAAKTDLAGRYTFS